MLPTLARRGVYVPKVTMMAALSTQTEAALTAALSKARWNDVRDEVREVGKLMREGTTNHSIDLPSSNLKQDVTDRLRGLHRLVENEQRNDAFAQVRMLKSMVKDELYRHRQQQMRAFSAMTEQRVDAFEDDVHDLRWADVEGEVEEVRKLMHEGSTNHAVDTPDVELEKIIETTIDDIKQMLEKNPDQHGFVFRRIHALKGFVKERLYNGLTTKDHVSAFEKEMNALHWTDVRDEVEAIRQLMKEGITNHAVALPSEQLEKTVHQALREVESMMEGSLSAEVHTKVFDRIHKLKSMVKAEIYH